MAVAEHLDFNVPRGGDIFLQQHARIAECAFGLARRGFKRRLEFDMRVDPPHAAPAAPRNRLDQHGIADLVGLLLEELRALIVAVIAGRDRRRRLWPSAPWRRSSAPSPASRRPAARRTRRPIARTARRNRRSRRESRSPDAGTRRRPARPARRSPRRRDSPQRPAPISCASSARRVNSAPRSAGVAATIVRIPSRLAVRMMRQAISPRLGIRTLGEHQTPPCPSLRHGRPRT